MTGQYGTYFPGNFPGAHVSETAQFGHAVFLQRKVRVIPENITKIPKDWINQGSVVTGKIKFAEFAEEFAQKF